MSAAIIMSAACVPPTAKIGQSDWWNCGLPCPRPHELFDFAAQHDPDAAQLQTLEHLERVAQAYTDHCRVRRDWAFGKFRGPWTRSAYSGYRDRLRDYKASLTYFLRQARGETPTIPDWK